MYTESEVLDFVQEEDVKFVRLAFFDLAGNQKNLSIMADQLPRAFREGISFDASNIEGFENPEKSDLFLHPEASTLSVLPWRPNTGKVVRMFCEIKNPDGTPYKKDSRHLLKCAVKEAKEKFGIEFEIGTQFEFYLFKLDSEGEPTKIPFDNAGYMDIAPLDHGENVRRDICFTLEQMGIIPEASHHEAGPGQNEVDFHYSSPLEAADNASTFKWIVRTKAVTNGLHASFCPKPLEEKPGSGLHINISCNQKEKMPAIIGGILNRIQEITYYLNPTEKSYKRLWEGKCPHTVCWGKQNRSAIIRVPAGCDSGKDSEKYLELLSPDPGCNIYIAITLLIHAAIEGIQNNVIPEDPAEINLFDAEIAKKSKYKTLPASLKEAKALAEKSEFVKRILV